MGAREGGVQFVRVLKVERRGKPRPRMPLTMSLNVRLVLLTRPVWRK